MALSLTKSYTFAPSTTIASSEVNTDLDTLYNAFSGLEGATASMSKLPLDADPSSALHAATKQYVDAYANYRRPNLTWISITTVDVANNTSTANQTKIVFPDGNYRSVTEDTSSANKYRRFDITATAEFTSGTEDSGLRSGLAEATNTWYAIYAVKSIIDTSKFVLVGDTTLPTQANVSTLDGRYATNGWVHLGLIRNGDNSAATGDILDFSMAGNMTIFRNSINPNVMKTNGTLLAGTAGATSLTYTFASGTGTAQVPNNIGQMLITASSASGGTDRQFFLAESSSRNINYYVATQATLSSSAKVWIGTGVNLYLSNTSGNSVAADIILSGFVDSVLGVGSNPFI